MAYVSCIRRTRRKNWFTTGTLKMWKKAFNRANRHESKNYRSTDEQLATIYPVSP